MSGADAPFNIDTTSSRGESFTKLSPIEKIMTDDYWANSHYPQMWMVKNLVTTKSFLELALKGEISWNEFANSKFSDTNIAKNLVENANKAHSAYGEFSLDTKKVENVWRTNITNVSIFFFDVLDLWKIDSKDRSKALDKVLKDPSKKEFFESFLQLVSSGCEVLKSQEALNLANQYRESLRDFQKRKYDSKTGFPTGEQEKLEENWKIFSDHLFTSVNKALNSANKRLTKPFPSDTMDIISHNIEISSKVVAELPKNEY